MLYTPLPVTALYKRLKLKGLIKDDLPFEEWHGQKVLNWHHPAFPGDLAEKWLNKAFAMEYKENASSIYRTVETTYRGYRRLAARGDLDDNLKARRRQLEERIREYRIMLEVVETNTLNQSEKRLARELQDEISSVLGPLPLWSKVLGHAARAAAALWKLRVRLFGDVKQPRTIYTRFPARKQLHSTSAGIENLRCNTEKATADTDTKLEVFAHQVKYSAKSKREEKKHGNWLNALWD